MENQISEASLKKVYHGTSLANFRKISKSNVLTSNVGAGVGSWNPGYVYLGTTFNAASAHGYGAGSRFYSEWDGGPPYVVLEFMLDESSLCSDPDNNGECKTWQESSEKNGQVAVKGDINLPSSTKVYFIGGEEWDTTMSTKLSEWEIFYQQNKEELFVPGEGEEE